MINKGMSKTKHTRPISGVSIRNPNQFKGQVDDDGRECTLCLIYKVWDEFGTYSRSPLGRRSVCKQCMREQETGRDRNAAVRDRRLVLKSTDPLKLKARTVRTGMLRRTNLPAPTIAEIERWLKSQPLVCHYTGTTLLENDLSVDHKIPLERGGNNELTNLCVCTKQMNTTKGTMTDLEFASLLKFLVNWEDGGAKVLSRLRMAGHAFSSK